MVIVQDCQDAFQQELCRRHGDTNRGTLTIRIQPQGWADRILARFGKKRAILIPAGEQPFGYYVAPRENFLRALLRPKAVPPPPGWTYWDDPASGEKSERSL